MANPGVGTDHGSPAEALRYLRQRAGLTQRQLADMSGISEATIHDIEQHRTRHPRITTLRSLAAALQFGHRESSDMVSGGTRPAAQPATWQLAVPQLSEPRLRLCVLGALEAQRAGRPVTLGALKQRAVLGLLAVNAGSPLSREAIIDALWQRDPPQTAVGTLQAYVSRLRRLLDPGHTRRMSDGLLVSTAVGYQVCANPAELDLLEFRALVSTARRSGDLAVARDRYLAALKLWRGDPCGDVSLIRLHPSVMDIRNEYTSAVLELADVCARLEQPGGAVAHLRQVIRQDSFNEPAHAALMIALAGMGLQGEALQIYESLRRRLAEQLGIDPGFQLAEAHLRVLRQQVLAPADVHAARSGLPEAIRYGISAGITQNRPVTLRRTASSARLVSR